MDKITTSFWDDYELIDAGGNKKLERWGDIITIRPERQAYFKAVHDENHWRSMAHFEFVSPNNTINGEWVQLKDAESTWNIKYRDLTFKIELGNNKHLGLFPEQIENWKYLEQHVWKGQEVLNLFAYTGAASLVAKSIGAEVTHVDSSKSVVNWAKSNLELSGLNDVRWIVDDAIKYLSRLKKRGSQFDVIIMDPPAWGIGAKGKKWKLEEQLFELIELAYGILTNGGRLILNTYSPKIEAEEIESAATVFFDVENVEVNELWSKTKSNKLMYHGLVLRAEK